MFRMLTIIMQILFLIGRFLILRLGLRLGLGSGIMIMLSFWVRVWFSFIYGNILTKDILTGDILTGDILTYYHFLSTTGVGIPRCDAYSMSRPTHCVITIIISLQWDDGQCDKC